MSACRGPQALQVLTRVSSDQPVTGAGDCVQFESRGTILVCGPAFLSIPAGQLLAKTLRVVVCATEEVVPTSLRSNPLVMFGRIARISGYLGRFKVEAWATPGKMADIGAFSGNPDNVFDLVLDLNTHPLLISDIRPLGYQAPGSDPPAIAAAIADLAKLTGTFSKSRDLAYDEEKCVHTAQGVQGCNRCLTVCPAGALGSQDGRIRIDAHLCQGCATCIISCPTGALTPTVTSTEAFKKLAGADLWLEALATGTPRLVVHLPAVLPASTRLEMTRQLELAQAILAAVGQPPDRIRLAGTDPATPAGSSGECSIPSEVIGGSEKKRDILQTAIVQLYAMGSKPQTGIVQAVELPDGTPFGTVEVDPAACTLCMACVNLCPTGALRSTGAASTLTIVEDKCVQCHICERGCPEGSISLRPRLLLDPEARRGEQTLHTDTPHHCPGCDQAFAGHALLRRTMGTLLAQDVLDAAGLARLHYCPRCRIHHLAWSGVKLAD